MTNCTSNSIRRTRFRSAWMIVGCFLLSAGSVRADSIDDPDNVAWASIRGYSSEAFADYFDKKKAQGFRVIDIEADVIGGKPRYAAVWQKNTDGRGWASLRNLTHAQFSERWNHFKDRGFRLIDQESYKINGKRRYAGVWVENRENYKWASYRNVDSKGFSDKFKQYSEAGYRMIDVEAYPTGNGLRYAAVWFKDPEQHKWIELRGMSGTTYAAKFDDLRKQGYRVVDIESYRVNKKQRYAAIWVKNANGRGWKARRGMSAKWFGNWWKTYADQGFRLTDFEAYPTAKGTRYAGVWRQNGDRFSWATRPQVDAAVKAHRKQYDVPAISVAIAQNGKVVYKRGFGFADIDDRKVAHAGTVYRIASVSKAVSGTLVSRLADRGYFDLDRATSKYVPGLPSHHTHTGRELANHSGGVRHYYKSNDPTSNVSKQYKRAQGALELFIDDPLVNQPGKDKGYSTHSWTVLAAAMEGALDKRFPKILVDELSEPLALASLRCEFRNRSNTNRASLYSFSNGQNVEKTPDNISWKYAGGGMESNCVDLCRLGIKLLNGSVMSNDARDTMWSPSTLDNGTSYNWSQGWSLGKHEGRDVVAKNGAQLGAKSYWLIYPDDEIVIAVLINRKGGGHSAGGLAKTIGSILFNGAAG